MTRILNSEDYIEDLIDYLPRVTKRLNSNGEYGTKLKEIGYIGKEDFKNQEDFRIYKDTMKIIDAMALPGSTNDIEQRFGMITTYAWMVKKAGLTPSAFTLRQSLALAAGFNGEEDYMIRRYFSGIFDDQAVVEAIAKKTPLMKPLETRKVMITVLNALDNQNYVVTRDDTYLNQPAAKKEAIAMIKKIAPKATRI